MAGEELRITLTVTSQDLSLATEGEMLRMLLAKVDALDRPRGGGEDGVGVKGGATEEETFLAALLAKVGSSVRARVRGGEIVQGKCVSSGD